MRASGTLPAIGTSAGMPGGVGRRTAIVDVSLAHWTLSLSGLALYLWVIHSFRLNVGAIGVGLALLGLLTRPGSLTFPLPTLAFGAWLAWSTGIGLATSDHPSLVLTSMVEFTKILAVFVVVANVTRAPQQLLLFIATWLAIFVAYPLRGQMVYLAANQQFKGRYGWNFNFSNFNDFASFDILIIGMAGYVALAPIAPRYRKLAVAVLGGALLSFLLTQSRGAGLAVALTLPLYLSRSRHRTRIVAVLGMLVAAIVIAFPGKVFTRIMDISITKSAAERDMYNEADASAEQRIRIAEVAFAVFKSSPLTGIGIGAYERAHGLMAETRAEWNIARGDRDAHNLYLRILAETGVVGFALFGAMIVGTMRIASRREKQLRVVDPSGAEQLRILRYCLVAYMLSGFFGSFYKWAYMYMYLAIMISAAGIQWPRSGGVAAAPTIAGPAPASRRRWLQQPRRVAASRRAPRPA